MLSLHSVGDNRTRMPKKNQHLKQWCNYTFQQRCLLFLVLLSLTILSGCAKKLNLDVCVSNPPLERLECSKAKGPAHSISYEQANGYICVSDVDARTIWANCRRGPVRAIFCLLDWPTRSLYCSDGDKGSSVPLSLSNNYVCFSQTDTRTIFEYCSKR